MVMQRLPVARVTQAGMLQGVELLVAGMATVVMAAILAAMQAEEAALEMEVDMAVGKAAVRASAVKAKAALGLVVLEGMAVAAHSN